MSYNPVRAIRLSPSGPFITGTGAVPLLTGPGATGIIYRANGSNVTGPNISTATTIPGLDSLAWNLPSGYHYDFELYVEVVGSAGIVTAELLGHQVGDPATTWTTINTQRIQHAVCAGGADAFCVNEVDYAPTAQIDRIRVQLTGPSGSACECVNCSLRVASYVL